MVSSIISPVPEIVSPTISGVTTFITAPVALNGKATIEPTPHPVINRDISIKIAIFIFNFFPLFLNYTTIIIVKASFLYNRTKIF